MQFRFLCPCCMGGLVPSNSAVCGSLTSLTTFAQKAGMALACGMGSKSTKIWWSNVCWTIIVTSNNSKTTSIPGTVSSYLYITLWNHNITPPHLWYCAYWQNKSQNRYNNNVTQTIPWKQRHQLTQHVIYKVIYKYDKKLATSVVHTEMRSWCCIRSAFQLRPVGVWTSQVFAGDTICGGRRRRRWRGQQSARSHRKFTGGSTCFVTFQDSNVKMERDWDQNMIKLRFDRDLFKLFQLRLAGNCRARRWISRSGPCIVYKLFTSLACGQGANSFKDKTTQSTTGLYWTTIE